MEEKFLTMLIDKFDKSALNELDYNDGAVHLVLKKTAGTTASNKLPASRSAQLSQDEVNRALAGTARKSPVGEVITAPLVGTFYAAPGPDSPPFVAKGGHVSKGQTLCVLEAMKMMNRLEAEFDCEILDVKAKSGDLVEFGQALFEVKRA